MTAPGDLERDVMGCLWDTPAPMTVREVHARLSAGRPLAYTTVMTVLDRLAKKGLAVRTREDRAYLYSPTRTRAQTTAELMLDALGAVPDAGGRQAALLHFLGQVTPEETALLRAALQDR